MVVFTEILSQKYLFSAMNQKKVITPERKKTFQPEIMNPVIKKWLKFFSLPDKVKTIYLPDS